MNILIKNALTLVKYEKFKTKEMDIYIVGDKIVSLDKAPVGFEADKVINAMDKLVMPGLINMHTHQYMSLFRNIANDETFNAWLFDNMQKIEEHLTPEDVYWGTMLSSAESIRTGTTCVNDMFGFYESAIKATKDSGIRAHMSRGLGDDEGAEVGAEKLGLMLGWMKEYHGDPTINMVLAVHSPYAASIDYYLGVVEWAKKAGVPIHTHLMESDWEIELFKKKEGMSPIEFLDKHGAFEVPTIAAHCVKTTERDWEIMKEKGITAVINPASNMKLGNGFAPAEKMLEAGVNLCIGTDGAASNNTLNLFREMNLLGLISRGMKASSPGISVNDILSMATVNAAKALGQEGQLGEISVGAQADIVILGLKNPEMYPLNDVVSSLVYSTYGSEVETVMVAGNILLENKHFTQADEDMIYNEVTWRSQRLRNEAGI